MNPYGLVAAAWITSTMSTLSSRAAPENSFGECYVHGSEGVLQQFRHFSRFWRRDAVQVLAV